MFAATKWLSKTAIGFSTLVFVFANPLPALSDELDWWAINSSISQQLLSEERNLIQWALELKETNPKTPHDAIVKINICLRAALDDEACLALGELGKLKSDISNHMLRGIYQAAIDDHEAYDVARVLAETFAPMISDMALENRLIQHLHSSDKMQQPWSDEQLIAWLDARVESVRAYNEALAKTTPPNDNGWRAMRFPENKPLDFWRQLRIQMLSQMGRAKAAIVKLEADVRANPEDVEPAIEFLKSLQIVRSYDSELASVSLTWMAQTCRPAKATELQTIASLMMTLEQPGPAETMLRRAIATEVTDDELSWLSAGAQAGAIPLDRHRLTFAIGLREQLAACLLTLGKADESQVVMVEAANIREKNNLSLNAQLSGMVQSASGARVIEERIREQELENKNDPTYWRQRAIYFHGRGEAEEQELAIRRGLALCEALPPKRGKGSADMRRWLLSDLTRFLLQNKRHNEAVDLLLAEMNSSPADASSSEGAARSLAFDLSKYINSNEPIIWNWLAQRKQWSHTEERLLWRTLEAAPKPSFDVLCTRAEQIAVSNDADASKAAVLGWVLNRMRHTQRSTALLSHAIKTATDAEIRQRASFTLFESYLDLKDWRKAETMFDSANDRLTPAESPKWLGRIASIAAGQGDHKDAMRIWRRVANCGLRNDQLVEELSKQGLHDSLVTYFADVQRALPAANFRLPL